MVIDDKAKRIEELFENGDLEGDNYQIWKKLLHYLHAFLQSAVTGEIPDVRIARVTRVAVHPTVVRWLIAIAAAKKIKYILPDASGIIT